MSRERDIFLEALEQPSPEARAAFIERATVGDPKLKEGVEALLANDQADTFLELGEAGLLRNSMEVSGKLTFSDERIGDSIGRYKLLEKIGEGGFGVVYRAEQSEPVRRHVALKVIKLGMDTKSVVARFEAERQALALMDHPSIARVLDGGATPTGRPYFVMELVRGVQITEYCEANQTGLKERLNLFIQLCQAIQHAHQKGVIHRDLKPSNVLVTNQDGKPIPKVIDFGIAKAIEEPLTPKTILTNFHAFIGTPAYTSPEQAEMTGSDVDTRSDIYSLGVLLYELLTGTTPFDAKELTQSGLEGMRRTIREVEPPTPSARLRRAIVGKPAHGGSMLVDRDLDWIAMKCLEKDRARRYSTAQELASDLDRYLRQEPVLARPQSPAYRLHKAMRRHRTAFAAAAAILLVVAVGTTVSIWQAIRATRAERTAELGRKNEELLRSKAEREKERAFASQGKAELNEYVADVNLAHHTILAGNLARATNLLAKHRTAGSDRFEWRYLWRAAQGDEHTLLAQEPSSVLSLANSPEWLVVGLRDAVKIYDSKSGDLVKSLAKPGSSLALSTAGLLATAGKSTVRVWRISDWAEVYSITDHGSPLAFSPDGKFLAAHSFTGAHVFNSADGKLVSEIPNSLPPFAFAPRGPVLAIDSSKGIVLWDVAAAKPLLVLENSQGMFVEPGGMMRDKNVLLFSPDGNSVIAARNSLRDASIFVIDVWDTATGRKLASIPPHPNAASHSGTISGLAFAPDGKLLASASWDHSLRLWDFGAGQVVQTLHGNPSEVWATAFAADGRGIISGAKDGRVLFWPANAGAKEKLYEGTWTPIRFSKDGRMLAAINAGSKFVLLNLETGEPEDQLQLAKTPRWTGAISDDLRTLAEPMWEGGLRLWDLHNRRSVELGNRDRHFSWAAIAPDGATLLAGDGSSAFWWNLRSLADPPIPLDCKGALFARNGMALVTLHDGSIKRWDPKARSLKAEFPVEADFGFATQLALSDDGSILAIGSNPMKESENAVRLWNTRTGKFLGICQGHTQGIRWLALAPDGETLASVSDDSTLRFWNVQTQQELLSIQRLVDPIRDILFSADGQWLVAKTASGLRLLDGTRDPTHANAPPQGLNRPKE